ncbi:DUF1028 domain-containing protein [Cupriavidus sp. TMH.W2]|uniref:DUF1028 domain-containing protein n=1 Tax=Cupriavidus sp. TMH.W2 TaxID=3434465 RepID=UPI003D7701DF
MTWSIIARDPASGELGVCVASRFLAVGGLAIYGDGRYGVAVVQSQINPFIGSRILATLARQKWTAELMKGLGSLADRADRQFHVVAANGLSFAWTGSGCISEQGHISCENISVAGNMLASLSVIEITRATYAQAARLPFQERLLVAIAAGQRVGGDRRGEQSAALKVWHPRGYSILDLRVDDHPSPLGELYRMLELSDGAYSRFTRSFNRIPDHEYPAETG